MTENPKVRSLIMRTALAGLLLPLFLAGCVVTSERDTLPTGVTMLGSDAGYCDGPIEIDADPDVTVDEGESITLAVDDDEIDWQCLAGSPQAGGELECPDGTSYVRITRQEDEEEFTLECFGS
jgi:hypothetical protein